MAPVNWNKPIEYRSSFDGKTSTARFIGRDGGKYIVAGDFPSGTCYFAASAEGKELPSETYHTVFNVPPPKRRVWLITRRADRGSNSLSTAHYASKDYATAEAAELKCAGRFIEMREVEYDAV